MHEWNVGLSTISDIQAQKDKLLEFHTKSEKDKAADKRCSWHEPNLEQQDKVLHERFPLKNSEGAPISGPMLMEKAKYFSDHMGLTDQCAFSDGWLACFKLWYEIRQLDISGEQKSADHDPRNYKYGEASKGQ